jgi:peptidoglycan/LPS O-acetylase OafA/YrhL
MSNHFPQQKIHLKYRSDIDGLRAIAVLTVVLFHAFPEWISGGFIGVDIFFVISGYLISSMLFENIDNGTFSFYDFYSRRIRRIFPALLIVLPSLYLFGWFTLFEDEFIQLGKHMVGGASFLSNFFLWNESGYFDNIADTKPLLHLWSLGIEEQFYIVWPIFLCFTWKNRNNFLTIILLIALMSFIINITMVYTNPVGAFYSPLSRLWELLIGAILAYIVLYKKDLAVRWNKFSNAISVIGLSIFIVTVAFLTKNNLFPGWWALFPTLGGAFLIFAGPNAWVNRNILSNKVLVWFGLISFPLYLWHWPLLSFAHIIKGDASAELRFFLVVTSIVLAWLTYRFIEYPIRKGAHNFLKVSLLVLLMIFVGYVGWIANKRDDMEFSYKKMIGINPEQLRDLSKWEVKGMYPTGTCNPGFIYPEAHICAQTKNNELPNMVVFGDSHAFSAFWGISKSFGSAGHNVKLVGKGSGCLPLINQMNVECRELINKQIDWINEQKNIETVFISFRNQIQNSATSVEVSNFKKMMFETFQEFQKNHKKIVYLLSVPEARVNPRLCVGDPPFGRAINKEKCNFPEERELEMQTVYRNVVFEVLRSYPNIIVFDPATVFCQDGQCSINSGEKIMWKDDNHITESASYLQGQKIFLLLK